MPRKIHRLWLNANYLAVIGIAMIGWLWFLGWAAVSMFNLM